MKISLFIFLGSVGFGQLFILISIIAIGSYFILKQEKLGMIRLIVFAFYGVIIGIPLSYFFQPKFANGISGYFEQFEVILKTPQLLNNLKISIIIFTIIGVIIGYFVLRKQVTTV